MRIEYLLRPADLACEPTDTLASVARPMHAHEVSALAVLIGSVWSR